MNTSLPAPNRFWPFITITPLIVASDLFLQTHAALFSHPIYNSAAPQNKIVVPLALAGVALIWLFDSGLASVGFAFTMGGFLGNMLTRNFLGPVADYVSVPSWLQGGGWEFNLADTCLMIGLFLIILSLSRIWLGHDKRLTTI